MTFAIAQDLYLMYAYGYADPCSEVTEREIAEAAPRNGSLSGTKFQGWPVGFGLNISITTQSGYGRLAIDSVTYFVSVYSNLIPVCNECFAAVTALTLRHVSREFEEILQMETNPAVVIRQYNYTKQIVEQLNQATANLLLPTLLGGIPYFANAIPALFGCNNLISLISVLNWTALQTAILIMSAEANLRVRIMSKAFDNSSWKYLLTYQMSKFKQWIMDQASKKDGSIQSMLYMQLQYAHAGEHPTA